jgi:hypothetical protein
MAAIAATKIMSTASTSISPSPCHPHRKLQVASFYACGDKRAATGNDSPSSAQKQRQIQHSQRHVTHKHTAPLMPKTDTPERLQSQQIASRGLQSKIVAMSNPPQTEIVAGGLRYKSKVSGSQFSQNTYSGSSSMSCFFCGKHRLRALLTMRRIIGKNQTVCLPSCKALDETIAEALNHAA